MLPVGRSLYARIAGLYLVLTLVFCTILIVLTVRHFDAFVAEVQQRLNHDIAADLAVRLAPDIKFGLHSQQVEDLVQRVHEINPALDIYILDETGGITAAYTESPPPVGAQVDLSPIRRFIGGNAMLPIMAVNPAEAAGETKVFSAAPLTLPDDAAGYLYIILHGSLVETASSMLQDSYIVRGAALALSLLLVSVLAVGVVLFGLLTRRFRRLIQTVRSISAGNYEQRITVKHDDEIGQLGRAVNEMASMIQSQMEALHRTDEERRTLIANLSHDIRTPLTSLRGYTQRLASHGNRLDSAERNNCLDAVLINTEQLEHMTTQLASLALLDVRGQTVQVEPFSLGELVQDVVLKLRPAAVSGRVGLEFHVPDLPDVQGDIGLIDRVLSNLIANALESTPPGGQVNVDLETSANGVRLVVVDTGCGISAEELPLVTRRFYRTERGRASKRAGTGLGLAIASEILDLHDTVLELHSTVGAGSAIGFCLPGVIKADVQTERR